MTSMLEAQKRLGGHVFQLAKVIICIAIFEFQKNSIQFGLLASLALCYTQCENHLEGAGRGP